MWKRKTTATLTRLFYPEVPYLNEFVDYYLTHLEFDRLHFIVTDGTPVDQIRAHLAGEFAERCAFYPYLGTDPNRCTAEFLPHVTEDFLFNVDFDEFLYLHGLTIRELLKKHSRAKCFQFRWVLAPSVEYFHRNLSEICMAGHFAEAREVKSMGLRKRILSLNNHFMDLKRHPRPVVLGRDPVNEPFLIHFSSRGIVDILTKCIYTLIYNVKTDDALGKLKRILDRSSASTADYPHRFLLLKFQRHLPRRELSLEFPRSRYTIDVDLQREIVDAGLSKAGLSIDQLMENEHLKSWLDEDSPEIDRAVETYLSNDKLNFKKILDGLTAV